MNATIEAQETRDFSEFVRQYDVTFQLLQKWKFNHLPALIMWYVLIAGGVVKGWIDDESHVKMVDAFNAYEHGNEEKGTREIEAAGEEIRQKLLGKAKRGETWTE